MVEREQIISFLRSKGPSVPNDIKRTLGGDTMIFGAMLSELSGRGSVLISHVKKGSSPFYYLPGQETQLEKLIEFCNPKDQKTIALLKEKKVLRDKSLELFERVSLRQIKDYAKELNVNTAQGKMLFWRYYLVSESEAITLLKEQYNKPQATPVPAAEEKKPEPVLQQKEKEPETSFVPQAKIISSEQEFIAAQKEVQQQATKKETAQAPAKEVDHKESQQHLSTITPLDKAEFHSQILRYFKDADIILLSQEQIAKNREYEFVVKVPSALGHMEMYCRAKNKKKLNEGDVAPALLKAKTKDLPCIFLSNGDFTKKSLAIIEKEYKGLVIKHL